MPGAIGVISLYLILLLLMRGHQHKVPRESCIHYTALGDSIAWGLWGNLTLGYVHHLRDCFKMVFPCIKYRNLAQIGATSSHLLSQLRNIGSSRMTVRDSDIITICIGGNNLLKAVDYKRSVVDDLMAEAQITQFIQDWPVILYEIRQSIGSNAAIYAMTLYNPCSYNDPAYEIFDEYLQSINSIIADSNLMGQFSYQVADVYTLFETNPIKNWTKFYSIPKNIHPTDEGHKQIYLLHRQVMGL